jgi:dTDP-4-dehydrorhamnose 3,5-epimerase
MCSSGSIEDYVVDIRVGSPTFGAWDRAIISASERNAIVLDVGLGHAFLALEDNTTVTYLVTDQFKPHAEHAINPLDEDLGLKFALPARELLLSEKDTSAPGFLAAQATGLLPTWQG